MTGERISAVCFGLAVEVIALTMVLVVARGVWEWVA